MKHNVGGVDRVLRIIVGLVGIGWGIYVQTCGGPLASSSCSPVLQVGARYICPLA